MVSTPVTQRDSFGLALARWMALFAVVLVASRPSWALECPECPHPPPDVTCPAFDPNDPLLAPQERSGVTPNLGTIAGAFSVSSTGEAVYRVALDAPEGRAGVEPHLSLTYNSATGEGPFGVGFSLGGLSAITRCPSTVAEDGHLRGVRYDEQDHFCLDGLRLIAVGSAEHAADGSYTEYRTRPDTFQRVRAYHAFGADPALSPDRFVAWTKSGRVLEYGGVPSGRVMGKHGVVRAWWVTRERDRHDNAMDTSYRNELDPGDGHTVTHVPLRIDYTAHLSAPQKPATRAVTFAWTDWNYHTTAYSGGMDVSRRPHIDSIHMLGAGGVTVRSYGFTWDLDATQRGRLSTMSECAQGDPSKCRPPTRFTWMTQNGEGFTATDTGMHYPSSEQDDGFLWMMADVTGDGLGDLVTNGIHPFDFSAMIWTVARNVGGSFSPPERWATTGRPTLLDQPNVGSTNPDFRQFDVFPHDYDQDGATDIFYDDPTGGTINWLRADPSNHEFDAEVSGLALPAPLYEDWYPPKPLYADIDGDGVLDQIQCHQLPASNLIVRGSWELRRWTPNGFGPAEPITPFGDTGCQRHIYLHFVDLDRDGKTEILLPSFGYGGTGAGVPDCGGPCVYRAIEWDRASDGSSVWSVRDTNLPAPNWAVGSGRVIFADVNGDGLPDAVEASNFAGLSTHQLWTFLNTGDGFDPNGVLALPDGPASQDDYFGHAAPIDYDGDGQMDLLVPMKGVACPSGRESCWTVLKSGPEGIGQFTIVPTSIDVEDNGGDDPPPVYRAGARYVPRITDVDGDGRQDVMLAVGGTFKLYRNEGPRDLLLSVTDGMNPLDPDDAGFVPSVSIAYGNLIDHAKTVGIDPASPDAEGEIYLPHADLANNCSYPRTCVVGPRRVVSSYTLNNGQNEERHFSMRYRDGRAHRLGRGFLGFETVLTLDTDSGSGRLDRYDNLTNGTPEAGLDTFPFAHRVVSSASWTPDVGGAPFLLAELRYTDRDLRTRAGTGANNYFVYPYQVHTRRKEVAEPLGGFGPSETLLDLVAVQQVLPGDEVLDATDLFGVPDALGNVLSDVHSTVGVDDVRTRSRIIVNDEAQWFIGQVTDETECSTGQLAAQCRHTQRSYDEQGDVALEKHEDPDHLDTRVSIAIVRDAFGNVTSATGDDTLGHHRSACVSYDGDGLFPFAVGNPAGHISHLAFDPVLGVQTGARDPNNLTTTWEHDAFGRTTREIRPDQSTTEYSLTRGNDGGPAGAAWWALHARTHVSFGADQTTIFDGAGRPVKVLARGAQVKSCTDVDCTDDPVYQQDIQYDLFGRVASRSRPFRAGAPPGPHPSTTYQYDMLGRLVSETAPWGAVTSYAYLENTVLATMPGSSSFIENDPWGRPVQITDALNGRLHTPTGSSERSRRRSCRAATRWSPRTTPLVAP
jgi:YD repeat-containing protein